NDVMPCIIKCGTQEIVHGGVNDQEIAPLSLLQVDHARKQHSRVAGDQSPGLDLDLAAKMTNGAPDHLAIVEGQWRCLVGAPVGNAETAAQIETPDLVAVGTQHLGKFRELAEGLLEGSKRRELAADMDIDPHNL